MSAEEIDTPDYDGHVSVEFGGYRLAIEFDPEPLVGSPRSEVVVYGCDCAAAMADGEVRLIHEALGWYLRDRDAKNDQPSLFDGIEP